MSTSLPSFLMRETSEAHIKDDQLVQSITASLDAQMFCHIMNIYREQCHSPHDYDLDMLPCDPLAPLYRYGFLFIRDLIYI